MDEKFALIFKSTFQSIDLKIMVWVMSLPTVVIVHCNQEAVSWATITWDNAFSVIGRESFYVVTSVEWGQLASVVNTKFTSQTGRALYKENLHYLCKYTALLSI